MLSSFFTKVNQINYKVKKNYYITDFCGKVLQNITEKNRLELNQNIML